MPGSIRNIHPVLRLIGIIAAVIALAAQSRAGEEDLYAALMNRLDAVNDQLMKTLDDLQYIDPPPEIPERALSMRRNAEVTIGGEMRATYVHNKTTFVNPGFEPETASRIRPLGIDERLAELDIPVAKLLIDARVHKRWRVLMDFNASQSRGLHTNKRYYNPNTPGSKNPTGTYRLEQESDTLGQAYIELMKADHSGFGFLAGKMKMPFGLWDRPNIIPQSFLDGPNLSASYLGGTSGRYDRALLPHASRMIDPAFAFMANYQMRDIVRFEAAVFEERDSGSFREIHHDGSITEKSQASMLKSWQVGVSLMPLDGWELTMHFRNRHNAGRGLSDFVNSPHRWDFRNSLVSGMYNPRWDPALGQWSDRGTGAEFGSTTNEQSFIIGLAADIPGTKLQVRAEYAKGWNQNFNQHIKSEDVNLGLSYKMTPRLTLHTQGEWMQVKDGSWMTADGNGGWRRDRRNNHLYRAMAGVEYEMAKGMTLEAGWQYEYWRMKSANGSDGFGPERHINKANIFYMGTRFTF